MTDKALDTLGKSKKGFFLIVEEEGVDEFAHDNNGTRVLQSMQQLERTVAHRPRVRRRRTRTPCSSSPATTRRGGLAVEEATDTERRVRHGPAISAEDGPFAIRGSDKQFYMDWTTGGHTGVDVPGDRRAARSRTGSPASTPTPTCTTCWRRPSPRAADPPAAHGTAAPLVATAAGRPRVRRVSPDQLSNARLARNGPSGGGGREGRTGAVVMLSRTACPSRGSAATSTRLLLPGYEDFTQAGPIAGTGQPPGKTKGKEVYDHPCHLQGIAHGVALRQGLLRVAHIVRRGRKRRKTGDSRGTCAVVRLVARAVAAGRPGNCVEEGLHDRRDHRRGRADRPDAGLRVAAARRARVVLERDTESSGFAARSGCTSVASRCWTSAVCWSGSCRSAGSTGSAASSRVSPTRGPSSWTPRTRTSSASRRPSPTVCWPSGPPAGRRDPARPRGRRGEPGRRRSERRAGRGRRALCCARATWSAATAAAAWAGCSAFGSPANPAGWTI